MKRSAVRHAPDIQVRSHGDIPSGSAEYARTKVLALTGRMRQPILFARVKLTSTANPATERPALAQANLDVNGRPARAHAAAATMTEAIDAMQDRLAVRLGRLDEHWEARRGRRSTGPPEWRHGDEPTHRPDYFPRPVDERRIVRHKSFSLPRETPDEAAFEMESMDYDFHLFTEAASGSDSVIHRHGDGYRLTQVHPRPELLGPTAVPLTVSELEPPRIGVEEAKKRLDIGGFPFTFFTDEATGRGNVLYHRYDGHYGLITPVE